MTEILWRHLRALPYFRALIRAVEASYYPAFDLPRPILDVGCGDGDFASLVFDQPVDVGLDPWHTPIHEASRRHAYHLLVEAEGAFSPFASGTFASAFSNSVLEHIPGVDQVLVDLCRVLKPGAPFFFCVPNERYLSELALGRILGAGYTRWFKRISRVAHADGPEIWKARLEGAGFQLERYWHYFPPKALRALEWGHYFGLPSLVAKKLTGRWILAGTRWNLWLTERYTRRFASNAPVEDGTFTFYIAAKK